MAATVPTGIEAFDDHVGGLPSGTLTQVHGPAGAGKSSFALTLARHASPCCLILSERLHRRRVAEVIEPVADEVLVARPGTLEEQQRVLERGCQLLEAHRVGTVVLDSLTFLYRFARGSSKQALSLLFDQLGRMHGAARASDGICVFTNQVRGQGRDRRPIGGPGVRHVSDVIIGLDEGEGTWRRMSMDKHPFRAGCAVEVQITSGGIE